VQFDFDLLELLGITDDLDEIVAAMESYLYAMILLIALLIIIKWQGIRIGNKIAVGTVRGTIQIIMMGLILDWIFNLDNIFIIFGVLTFMGTFAAYTIRGNLEKIPGVFYSTLPGLLIGGLSVMLASLAIGVIRIEEFENIGEVVIPMGGMVIGNIMGLSSLVIDRMWSTAQKQRGLIETALSLGATPQQASDMTIRESIESGMLPNLNRYASLGIVSIPGLMSGMIIGGMSPVAAALYQVIIFIMIFLAVIIGSLIVSRLFIRYMFNERFQLVVPPPEA
jgi:putative ABC transport system permease protein